MTTTGRTILSLPDECLAHVFRFLSPADRITCSAVCRRWHADDVRTRRAISLSATPDLTHALPSILARFPSISTVILQGERRGPSVGDDALLILARLCPNLSALHIRACRSLTDDGLAAFAASPVASRLRELSVSYCSFGAKGCNAVVDYCYALESLSLGNLTGFHDGVCVGIGGCVAAASLRTLSLVEFFTGNRFAPLIVAAEKLTTLKAENCSGDWDQVFAGLAGARGSSPSNLTEVHLVRLIIRDVGLRSMAACCPNLETLRLGNINECTDAGVVAIAKRCKRLRDVQIDGGFSPSIGGDVSLAAIADHCRDLRRFRLVGASPTAAGFGAVAVKCEKLERLAVRRCKTFDDAAMACIGTHCGALKEMSIKWCRNVTDKGLMELGRGCPRLEKVKLNKCPLITADGIDSLLALKGNSIVVARGDCH